MAQITPGSYYTVQPGDSLSSIAQQAYGDSSQWQLIYNANRQVIGNDPNTIYPGQVLYIPPTANKPQQGSNYTVQPGDSLSSIAQQAYGDSSQWTLIYNANQQVIGPNPNLIRPGQVLYIPYSSSPPQPGTYLPPSTASALTGFAPSGTSPRVYYTGANLHVYEVAGGTGWSYRDLMVDSGNAPLEANAGSALTSFGLGSAPRVYYFSANHRVYQLAWNNGWSYLDVTNASGNAPTAATGSALTGFALAGNSPRVYYLGTNNHVYELAGGTGWSYSDVTNASGNAPAAAAGSALTGFALGGSAPRVYYLSSNNHVYELAWNNGWSYRDVTNASGNAPAAAAGSALTGFALGGNSPRVYYLGSNNRVYELAWNNGWSYSDVTSASGNAPAAAAGSALTGFALGGNSPRVYYLGSNNRVYELAWNNGWSYSDLTSASGNAPPAATGSALTSFGMDSGLLRVYYISANSRLYQLGWDHGWSYLDVTPH